MMSNALVGLIAAIGFGTWIYTKTLRSSGGNVQSALTVAAIAGGFVFLTVLIILKVAFG